MRPFDKTITVFFGLALLGVLGAGGYFAAHFIARFFARMGFQVAAIISIASVVTLLASMIISSSIRRASTQVKANQLRAEKTLTYQLFIDLWASVLRQESGSEDGSRAQWRDELQTLERLLILYGSPGVVKAHAAMQALERKSGARNSEARPQFARALMEIRKDLGSQTQGLTAQELQQLLFANTERADARIKANAYQDQQPRVSLTATFEEER